MLAGRWRLPPIILATQEAEVRRITVRSQPRRIVLQTLSQKKKTHHTKGEGGLVEWLKVQALSSNPSTGRKKNKFKMHFFQEGPSNELPPTLITSLQVLSSWTTSILYSNSIF
jgi:hypothetical protein